MKEYKAVIYQENLLSSLVFGSAKINPVKFSDFLNSHASSMPVSDCSEDWSHDNQRFLEHH